jgi:hypothetical protein
MSFFEYKVVPAPSQRRWRQQSVDGMDKYASTVADLMTEMGLEGWDFIGAEQLKERRRRFFVLICDVERTLMIFRRAAKLHDFASDDETSKREGTAPVSEPVQPRRVKRPDLIAEVANGARRVQVNVVRRVDEPSAEDPASDADDVAATPVAKKDTPTPSGKAHMLERAVQGTKAAANVAAE